jgi:hypothetical protein
MLQCVVANQRALPTGGSDRGKNIDKRNTEKGEHKADAKKGRLPARRPGMVDQGGVSEGALSQCKYHHGFQPGKTFLMSLGFSAAARVA